jgi:hypothetical protein
VGELFGDNLLQQLLLALSAALVVGNLWALWRPPPSRARPRGDLARAPRGRSALMIGIGLLVMIWTIASLV